MQRRIALTTGLAAATLLALTGCFSGTAGTGTTGSGDEGSTGGESTGNAMADCMIGTWDLDTAALARSMGEQLQSSGGLTVVSTDASGPVRLTVTPDRMSWTSDVTYVLTVQDDELTLSTIQLQSGTASGEWDLDADGWATFSGWESDILITTTTVVNGSESAPTTSAPGTEEDGVPLVVTCDGALMSTQSEGSPHVNVWTRQ